MKFFEGGESRWISMDKSLAAPYFFTTFKCAGSKGVKAAICGLGYYELYVNGSKVGTRELAPTVTVYDRRVRNTVLDISKHLVEGENAVGVVLGAGWYYHVAKDVWNF